MLALAIALSFVKLWEMPLGGSVTLVSMLPIFLISIKYGLGTGLGTAFVYSLFQLLQAVMQGDVFIYCETWVTLVICVLFDYLLPFTLLGLAGICKNYHLFRVKKDGSVRQVRDFGLNLGIALAIFFRFVCHFVTGVFIWGQWAPEGMGKFGYSLLDNGGYLSIELILTVAVSLLLLSRKEMRKILGLKKIEVKID